MPAAPYAGPTNGSPWPAAPTTTPAAPSPRVARGQAPEETNPASPLPPLRRPALLTMPSPEQLGVAGPRPGEGAAIDWAAVHARLGQLGATCFHLERLAQGGCRISCLLPTREQGRSHRVDAEAGTEADAVRLALARAEEWAGGR